ncbi:hypothetical protein OBBRIDRAFT_701163, partial [Obba rivulosa]
RRYGIRADIFYDRTAQTLTALLELPGVQRADVRLRLLRCPHTRVRVLLVEGTARAPAAPAAGHAARERRYGEFMRVILVPPETQTQDVQARMEDGVLTVCVPGVQDAESEPPQDVPL